MPTSAYDPTSTFSDAEMSRNVEDRRGQTDMDRLSDAIETTFAARKRQSTTEGDVAYDTATPRGATATSTPAFDPRRPSAFGSSGCPSTAFCNGDH